MTTSDKSEREIRKIAYALWLQDGQPDGRDREHWTAAKELWAYQSARHEAISVGGDGAEPLAAVENQAIAPDLDDQAERNPAPRRGRTGTRMPLSEQARQRH
jgi:hypothetical protein